MSDKSTPKPYEEWRTEKMGRAEDAAHTFGYYLMQHCRAEALKDAPTDAAARQQVEAAVDTALHNVMDLFEGYWRLPAGPKHVAEFDFCVRIRDEQQQEVERVEISASRIDLPIGYWMWQSGEFR